MEIGTLKLELIKELLAPEEKAVLKKIAKILFPRNSKTSEVLGYDHLGNPYTIKDLLESVKNGDEAIKKGEGLDHDSFRKEAETW